MTKFEAAVNSYIQLYISYENIEKALYGQSVNEGKTEENLQQIEEYLLGEFLGDVFSFDSVFNESLDYIYDCIINHRPFSENELNTIVAQALDEEAQDALRGEK